MEEENVVQIDFDPQIDKIINEQMDYCPIGKLLSPRTIIPSIIRNTFANAWQTNLGFKVEGLGET